MIRIANVAPIGRDSTRPARCARFDSRRRRWRRGISRTAIARGSAQDWAAQCATGRAADMPTCRHADMPHCRHCRHCRRSPAKPLVLTRQATQPHTHSATGVPSALHRRSIDERANNERSTPNARDRDAPRGAPRMRARSPPASREPSSRLAAQCLQSLDHAEQRAAVLFGAVPRLDDRLAQQIVVRRRQPGRLPRLDAIETA